MIDGPEHPRDDIVEPEGTSAPASSSTPDLVRVDQLGVPRRPAASASGAVVALGIPETARQRLRESGDLTLYDTLDGLDQADAVLVSSRMPRSELTTLLAGPLADVGLPVVGVVHTGGEAMAVELARSGAVSILAEGNEAAVLSLLADTPGQPSLLETFARYFGRHGSAAGRGHRDPATGLPDRSAFDDRVEELLARGDVPRIGFVRITGLADAAAALRPAGRVLLRRRLAALAVHVARAFELELYAGGDGADLLVVGPTLSPGRAEHFGADLDATVRSFAFSRSGPLGAAMGHAGAEAGTTATVLVELAQRAMQVASVDRGRRVVGAESLVLGVSSTTELEAATRIVDHVEAGGRHGAGHGERVAAWAAELARELGYEASIRAVVELAGRLHEVGKAALPTAAWGGPMGLADDLMQAYRSYPGRSARYLAMSGGSEVADAVGCLHEWWDGSGFPDGRSGIEIPVAARLLAVAHAVEEHMRDTGGDSEVVGASLHSLGGRRLDPDMVAGAIAFLASREPADPMAPDLLLVP